MPIPSVAVIISEVRQSVSQFISKVFSGTEVRAMSRPLACVQGHSHTGTGLSLFVPAKGNCNAKVHKDTL